MLVKLHYSFQQFPKFYLLCSQILPIILKLMLGLMLMAFQKANNILLINYISSYLLKYAKSYKRINNN